MKRLLATCTILALTAGVASAEITFSGDARMGIINDFGASDVAFTSRARIKFTLSGETDSGLAFGADFRADNAGAATSGKAGEVFVSGGFGKLTMGDIDGAAQQAVGNVDGVGLTGLGDLNEATYVHNVINTFIDFFASNSSNYDPTAAYEYTTGGFTGIVSVSNPNNIVDDPATPVVEGVDLSPTYALGLKYATGGYTFALGYETNSDFDVDHVILGVNATFGAVALKANYGQLSAFGVSDDQWHVSATYTADALAVTAFAADEFGDKAYGLGAAYELGGNAKVVGGYVNDDSANADAFDLGLSFSF